ncbi:S-formylglutathione hydrolase FrmB [Sediminibacterium magnilacihabitans]|nr:S-formylglutathione hydrolase FrmB [Sediminibacterium magnilacihabitans]
MFLMGILFALAAGAAVTDTIKVYSNSMHKDIKVVIIRPAAYDQDMQRHFPVVYLLHGYSGNHASWLKDAPQLPAKADELNMILVCPDGGYNSWYFDSPVDSTVRYETFVTSELMTYIDGNYRTVADRHCRAIAGLSMGGHGAFYLGMRHKDLFGAAGSMAGGVDIRPFPRNWDMVRVLGDTLLHKDNWERNTVINIASGLKNGELKLVMACGVGDFFLQVNRDLHRKLLEMKIDHDYTERPGAHNRDFWGNSVDYQLLFFKKYFENFQEKIGG